MAFVPLGWLASVSIASSVGRISRSIFRRRASRFTSSITGSDPYLPVPITRRRHFQGTSSSNRDRSVPELLAEFLGGLLLALADLAAVDDHVIFLRDTV